MALLAIRCRFYRTVDIFSLYQKVIPRFFGLLGAGNEQLGTTAAHHTPDFNLDEAAPSKLLDYLERLR